MAYLTQQSWSPIDLANHETKAEKNKIKTSKNVHVRIQNTAEFPVQILGNSEETERKHCSQVFVILLHIYFLNVIRIKCTALENSLAKIICVLH